MKYLNTKINIKKCSIEDMMTMINELHHIESSSLNIITYYDWGFNIRMDSILAYRIHGDSCLYEYIYDEESSTLALSIDCQDSLPTVDLLGYLIDHDYHDDKTLLYPSSKPFYLDDVSSFIDFYNQSSLPIVYFGRDYDYIDRIADELKGVAYVVIGSGSFKKDLSAYFHLRGGTYIFYLNNEICRIYPYKHESRDDFVERLILKVQNYVSHRKYNYPFVMDDLYKDALTKAIEKNKVIENTMAQSLEEELKAVEDEKNDYENKIDEIHQKILLMESYIDNYESIIESQSSYPLLLKGNIAEFYEGEQKDMVLYLLNDELKRCQDPAEIKIIEEILSCNDEVGQRKEYLTYLKQFLLGGRMNPHYIDRLKKCGISLSKDNGHYVGMFFDNPKYSITVASTPSDQNFGHNIYRQIRSIFF